MSERTVACIMGGIVQNVIVVGADYTPDPTCEVEYTADMPVGIGWEYDGTGFIPPQPFPSWVLNDYVWEAPVAMPDDDAAYYWDERSTSWAAI